MTYQISKNIKTHIVLTDAGNKYYITSAQEKALRSMGINDRLVISDSTTIKVRAIKEILPINDYYNQHPEERPQEYKTFVAPKTLPYSAKRHLNALKQMREGFLKHFAGRKLPPQSQDILDTMNEKIKNFKTGDTASPAKVFFGDRS